LAWFFTRPLLCPPDRSCRCWLLARKNTRHLPYGVRRQERPSDKETQSFPLPIRERQAFLFSPPLESSAAVLAISRRAPWILCSAVRPTPLAPHAETPVNLSPFFAAESTLVGPRAPPWQQPRDHSTVLAELPPWGIFVPFSCFSCSLSEHLHAPPERARISVGLGCSPAHRKSSAEPRSPLCSDVLVYFRLALFLIPSTLLPP